MSTPATAAADCRACNKVPAKYRGVCWGCYTQIVEGSLSRDLLLPEPPPGGAQPEAPPSPPAPPPTALRLVRVAEKPLCPTCKQPFSGYGEHCRTCSQRLRQQRKREAAAAQPAPAPPATPAPAAPAAASSPAPRPPARLRVFYLEAATDVGMQEVLDFLVERLKL